MDELARAKDVIVQDYETLNYAAVIRRVCALADVCNKYVEDNQPWSLIKTDPEKSPHGADRSVERQPDTDDLFKACAADICG